jgi:hypothetical protein
MARPAAHPEDDARFGRRFRILQEIKVEPEAVKESIAEKTSQPRLEELPPIQVTRAFHQ